MWSTHICPLSETRGEQDGEPFLIHPGCAYLMGAGCYACVRVWWRIGRGADPKVTPHAVRPPSVAAAASDKRALSLATYLG